MKRLLILLLLALPLLAQNPKPAHMPQYDPHRDPAQDLRAAITEAHQSDRNILVDVGGNWCKWCHFLENFFASHDDLRELRDKNYVLMYVNFSEENKNDAFLKQFPAPTGYPHLYVLNPDGKLIHSENTSELEDGKTSYNPDNVRAFLMKYGPQKQTAAR